MNTSIGLAHGVPWNGSSPLESLPRWVGVMMVLMGVIILWGVVLWVWPKPNRQSPLEDHEKWKLWWW